MTPDRSMRRTLVGLTLAAALTMTPRVVAQHPASAAAAPAGYVIGPDDVLSVVFWRDKDMSTEVTVRPDGKISLPLFNDVQAGGLTPDQLRDAVGERAKQFVEDPSVTVIVKQINSRKVFITGQVEKPGPYPVTGPTSVVQLISIAGGLKEYADDKHILIVRKGADGRPTGFRFNYRQVLSGRDLKQNIDLQPGDTVVVP